MTFTFEITIPVLNEAKILEDSISTAMNYLDAAGMNEWKLAIADNGSTDETPLIATHLSETYPQRIRYLRLHQRGVGLALRQSWSTADTDIVGYMDADLATSLSHLKEIQMLFNQQGVSIVNGSRLLHDSSVIGRSLMREITSRGLNTLMHLILHNRFTDAMCGFKFFERSLALELFKEIPVIPDWFVAAELLVRAEWLGYAVYELPVTWTDDINSKANIKKLVPQYLRHIKRLKQCKGG